MKALSFFGLFAAVALFGLSWALSYQNCYAWYCSCDYRMENKDTYLILSLVASVFFLIYCVLFLFKISEKATIVKKETAERLLDASLVERHYSLYELPLIKLINKLGLALSLGLIAFAWVMANVNCIAEAGCNTAECGDWISYDKDLYTIGYGAAGIYFITLTVVGLLKSYPSKY